MTYRDPNVNGHYGVICDVCHVPVEYADITTHKHVRPTEEVHESWNYTLSPEQQEAASRFRRRTMGIYR